MYLGNFNSPSILKDERINGNKPIMDIYNLIYILLSVTFIPAVHSARHVQVSAEFISSFISKADPTLSSGYNLSILELSEHDYKF